MVLPAYRELELYIGPLEEWKGNKGTTRAIKIVSNGNNNTLKVRANISKHCVSIMNQSTIQIWNLSRDTINAIRRGRVSVNLYVGYENAEKELLYTGGIIAVKTARQGSDFITTLVCMTGGSNLAKSVASKSFTSGVAVTDIVKELASSIPGITVDDKNISIQGKIGYAGWSFIGSTKDALDKLAYQYGFSWNIQDGSFQAVQDGKTIGRGILLNASSGLRKVSPRLTGPLAIQEGVDIQAQWQPNSGPGRLVRVVSETNPELNGSYACHSIEYDLCPKEESWDMSITSFFTFGAWNG